MQGRKGTKRRASKRLERCSKGRKSGATQRGKSAAKQCTVRRTGKRSKREREWHAYREEKRSKRGG